MSGFSEINLALIKRLYLFYYLEHPVHYRFPEPVSERFLDVSLRNEEDRFIFTRNFDILKMPKFK